MDYSYLKLIHLIAVTLFLGNIITGLFWMRFAVKTKDVLIIRHTMWSLIKLDNYFTIPGVIVITAGGILAAIYGHFPILRTGWIFWSIVMFSISGLVFGFKLAPLQKKIYKFASEKEKFTDTDWIDFNRSYLAWDIWGIIATLTPFSAFVMMVLKIPN